ncbi:ZYRO0F12298p [Zygosaccharomyces rouxii]|uniref:ZYRO0F12298p n=1 Tax=Zygosaccharomyces rouxii (strain ATCC 2623 / CBS 732 / NBRC 1130 / NCYC 568 / NRRL Y-229) TaxID=559307 RepID=C5DYE1_ZYGRC|nr:uncharacterized protein ZYRO0F12298g [Zygosaccharomyces rouxii]KAH9199560.1 hypothetical protein LQ764DRAFT_235304 [Zygosaccharomyces rouxii]CAR28802.1 ZYRO0F12298p [Zygosaccharomyces rouxii]
MMRQQQRNDTKRRDVFGRNYSYLQSCLPHMGELETIDLYSHDLESGYTPLHVTLKQGHLQNSFKLYKHWKDEVEYLSHKFGGHVLGQVDREGLTPLELYDLELEGPARRFPQMIGYRTGETDSGSLVVWGDKPPEQSTFGSYVLTWGSNVNYQLGTGTKDDRQNMFQLVINQLETHGYLPSGEKFKQICMRRYHSLILTTDNKIYTCGTGSRGRLGNGTAESPQPTFTQAWDLKGLKVKMVASSDHHTLVLTEDDAVYSWGWNAYGQSGQSLGKKSDDKNVNKITVSSPKRINFLDNDAITFVACSKIHSCAATASGNIILWGLNLGQMGGSKPVHATPDSQYHDEDGYIVRTPMVVSLPNHQVEQIVCTEMVTFIRTQGNTLHVLSNYTMRTFKIPLPKSRTYKEIDAFDHFTPREVPSEVVDMKCSNRFGNRICFKYASGRIGIINWKGDSTKMWSKMPNSLPVNLYWTPNLQSNRCADFDVSAQGKLLICTVSGEVYTLDGVNSRPEKVHSSKLHSGRAVNVSCDSSFGSFAILKSEFNEIPMIYPKDTLYFDFSQYSPLKGKVRDRHNLVWGLLNEPQFRCADYLSNHKLITEVKGDEKNSELRKIKDSGSSLANFEDARTTVLAQQEIFEDANFDVAFVDSQTRLPICYCHKLILQSRCQKLLKSIADTGRYDAKNSGLEFVLRDRGKNENVWNIGVKADKDASESLQKVTHFLYTDERHFGQSTSKLLFDLVDNSHHLARLPISLQESWKHNNSDSHHQNTSTDVRILVNDGILEAHELVLSTRSAFFQIILNKDWVSRNDDGYKIIDLRQIESANQNNVEFVLGYIYGMEYEDLCSKLDQRSFTEYLQFFLEVLELSDFFNLESFKNFLESLIANYITGETVIPILINAAYYNCRLLAFNCCWFLCTHVGMLFSKENIELVNQHFDSEIWQSLERVLREMRNSSASSPDSNKSWYDNKNFDWLALFRNNIRAFNDRFIDPKHRFVPIFDLKPREAEPKQRTKSSNRKASFVHGNTQTKSRQSSTTGEKIELRRPSHIDIERKSAWADRTDDTAIEDIDDFTEVMKKPRRRLSSRPSDGKSESKTESSSVLIDQTPRKSGKVVLHSAPEESNVDLPSLFPISSKSPNNDGLSEMDTSSAKMSGAFKKVSQKQRMKHIVVEEGEKSLSRDQQVWKKSSRAKSFNSSSSSSAKNNLPSLYDHNSSVSLNVSKKEKKKNHQLAPNTEFVSHGNLGGISPYLQKTAMKQASAAAESSSSRKDGSIVPPAPASAPASASAGPTMTLEEKLAAQQFEKWFAEQAKSVQKQLHKKKNKNLARELDVVYNAAETLPDFVQGSDDKTKKGKKKLKLKFQSRQVQE